MSQELDIWYIEFSVGDTVGVVWPLIIFNAFTESEALIKESPVKSPFIDNYLANDIKSFIRLCFPDNIEVKEYNNIKYIEYLNNKTIPTVEELYNRLYNIKDS